jgi:hypothetical protein
MTVVKLLRVQQSNVLLSAKSDGGEDYLSSASTATRLAALAMPASLFHSKPHDIGNDCVAAYRMVIM